MGPRHVRPFESATATSSGFRPAKAPTTMSRMAQTVGLVELVRARRLDADDGRRHLLLEGTGPAVNVVFHAGIFNARPRADGVRQAFELGDSHPLLVAPGTDFHPRAAVEGLVPGSAHARRQGVGGNRGPPCTSTLRRAARKSTNRESHIPSASLCQTPLPSAAVDCCAIGTPCIRSVSGRATCCVPR